MRLRTFTANDMPSAMKLVREALGDNAVILSTETLKGRKGISVIAAVDPDPRQEPIGNSAIPRPLASAPENLQLEIQKILRFHNIPEHFVSKLMHKASHKEFESFSALHHISANRDEKPLVRLMLEKLLANSFKFDPVSFDGDPLRLMLIGPPGIGKTLTVAKMATRLAMEKQPVMVFTTDNQRAGGVEQLQAFTDILETGLYSVASASELARELKNVHSHTHVLVDTAGCNPYNNDELRDLKLLAQQKGIEPVMVLPAGGDSAETVDIVEAFSGIDIRRLIVTRADTARRFGGIMTAAHKLALANVSTSSSIVNSLEPMDAGVLAQMLLKYSSDKR